MNSPKSSFNYRPEIDGLRAIAVLGVVLFHAGIGFQGGFVGVDVFFVISGFLITSLIVKDIESGNFSFPQFFVRRIRRILPPLVFVVTICLIAGFFLLLPVNYMALARATIAQALCAANIYYWRHTGYFDGKADEQPLLHTWSLGVEEQFYFFIPLLIVLAARVSKTNLRRRLILIFLITAIFSFSLSLARIKTNPTAVFYLMPPRSWELLVGALISQVPFSELKLHRIVREVITIVGMAGIVVPMIYYDKSIVFPGIHAVPPTIGAGMVILGCARASSSQKPTLVDRILRNKMLVFIGLISYSLYLWHWPVLAFATNLYPSTLSIPIRCTILLFVSMASIATWHFVETPFRNRQVCASDRSAVLSAGATTLATLALAYGIVQNNGLAERFPKSLQNCFASEFAGDELRISELTTADIVNGNLTELGASNSLNETSVFIWGDSHAMASLPAFHLFLKSAGLSGQAATHSATAPVLGWYNTNPVHGLNEESLPFGEHIFEHVRKHRIPNIVLVGCWSYYDQSEMRTSLLRTVRRFKEIECQPWVLLQVPFQPASVPKSIFYSYVTGRSEFAYCARPSKFDGITSSDPDYIDQLVQFGANVVDPRPAFFEPDRGVYRISFNGAALYYDDNHLSRRGAEMILEPVLRAAFSEFTE